MDALFSKKIKNNMDVVSCYLGWLVWRQIKSFEASLEFVSWALKFYKSIAFWPLPCSYRIQTAASLEFSVNLKHAWNLCDVSLWKFSLLVHESGVCKFISCVTSSCKRFCTLEKHLKALDMYSKSVSKIDHYWVYTIYPQTCLARDLVCPGHLSNLVFRTLTPRHLFDLWVLSNQKMGILSDKALDHLGSSQWVLVSPF
jgi:hypothetical protein